MNQQIITAKYWLVAHIFLFNLFWPIPESAYPANWGKNIIEIQERYKSA